MSEKEFLALYEHYLQGKCTPEEIQLLERYQDDFQWKTWTSDLGNKERIHDEIYHRLHQEIHPVLQKTKYSAIRWMAAAAVLIIATGGMLLFNSQKLNFGNKPTLNNAVFQTRMGEKKQIILQDGTTVWLNAGSKLILAKDFNEDRREVELVGEAYFDVTHSKSKPFEVHTKMFNINVLGTAFNVKAYPTDLNASATLIRGSIAMRGLSEGSKQIILKPSEKAVFLNLDQQERRHPKASDFSLPSGVSIQHYMQRDDSVIVETAWKSNNLEIYDQTFAEIKDILERWYDIEIIFQSSKVKNYRFRANFKNESIIDVLKSLKKAQYFNYEMKDRTVTIFE